MLSLHGRNRRGARGLSGLLPSLALLLLVAVAPHASALDASGTWRGSATETIACSTGNGVRNLSVLMVVVGDSSGAFSAETTFSGTETFNGATTPFFNQAAPFVGTVAADGSTTAQFQSSPPIDTTGVLSGDTWNLSYVQVFGLCTFNLSMTLVRNGVNPEEAPSTQITSQASLLSSTRTVTTLQQTRIASLFGNQAVGASQASSGFLLQGVSAGDGEHMPVGVWGSYSASKSKNDFNLTQFSSSRYSLLGGVDVMPRDWLIAGVAFGYETADTQTFFNGGEQRAKGFTASPYVAMLFTDRFMVDVSAGLSHLENIQFRTGTTNTGAPVRVDSRVDTIRRFFSINANYGFEMGPVIANLRAGYLWAKETQRDFVESDGTAVPEFSARIAQIQLGGDVAYRLGALEPFARVSVERDISATQIQLAGGLGQLEQDNTGVVAGFGVRYFDDAGFSAQLEYNTILARENLTEDLFSATLRASF